MYLIHTIKHGTGTLTIDNHTHHLSENDTFLIRPHQLAIYTSDSKDPWEYCYFAFNGAFASDLVERTVFKNKKIIHKLKDGKLSELIYNAANELPNAIAPDITALEYFFKFLPLLCNPITKTSNEQKLYLKYIMPAQQYIELHYSEPIQVSYFTKQYCIDRSYFFKLFKKFTGMSPEKYIIAYRIQRAKLLISATDIPLSTISKYVGYENYPPFFSMFNKIVGLSPQKYRDYTKSSITNDKNLLEETHLE